MYLFFFQSGIKTSSEAIVGVTKQTDWRPLPTTAGPALRPAKNLRPQECFLRTEGRDLWQFFPTLLFQDV